MDVNIGIIALVLVAVIVLIGWLIRRNKKDKRDFAKTLNESALNPDKDSNKEKI
ncbi:hypothetical protein [Parapedobacter koreensis]|uniref:LPXTG-motif cell wall anchor domain-containing protein n=1 Tax=Parapedobacter koreensis TaxID=332977 RepID=A0A1H7RBU1_9SPHI|nr:hypothetical protein [Parapedobacter koreensis]SEL57691.1 hypothetical protein SAMN05421740_10719 [Parapedobacter koreensis]